MELRRGAAVGGRSKVERKRREEDEKEMMNKRKDEGCRNDPHIPILIFHEERQKPWSGA